ncbi:MAG TPA: 5-(carboxyamino)imidazole ribonucleotide mutase [Planctomycetota bacterium]
MIEIRTGSDSDIPKIKAAHETLTALGVPFQERVLSAHRTPQLMADEARRLEGKGFKVSIAAAGGAAHLPGMTASETLLPVIGIPVPTQALGGLDSLYSIAQMPEGCPVGCVGVGQAEAAALLAAQILALDDPDLMRRVRQRKGLPPGATPPKSLQVGLLGLKPPAELLDLLQRFGLTPREATSPAGPERDGVCALIAICDKTNLDLPSSLAARTHLPVIALPLLQERFDPFEAMLGTSPLAGMGINRPKNAAIYAAMIAGRREPLREYRESLRRESEAKDAKLTSSGTRRP